MYSVSLPVRGAAWDLQSENLTQSEVDAPSEECGGWKGGALESIHSP